MIMAQHSAIVAEGYKSNWRCCWYCTYDAVNYGQLTKGLNEVRSGISAVSAMANIHQVEPNKNSLLALVMAL